MESYVFPHLADHTVLEGFDSSLTQTCSSTARMLAYLAEVDARKLYLPAAYPSMREFCVREKRMSKDTAHKRIRVARTARAFPAIFPALADGRLHPSAVLLLAKHLTADSAEDLLEAAAGKTDEAIELLLAHRFPRPDVPTQVVANTGNEVAVRPPVPTDGVEAALLMEPLPAPRAKVDPLSPGRYGLHFTIDQATHDKLQRAQELLGHAAGSGDVAKVFDRALDALVRLLEKQKFAACDKPRVQRRSANGRHIPAEVKRAVRQRDGDQCTFESAEGRRCEAREGLEWDHIEPVARGGQSTIGNVRLRCRAHNQYAAEQTFGSGFIEAKRQAGRERAAESRAVKEAQAKANAEAREQALREQASREQAAREEADRINEIMPWLRQLGYNQATARRGAEASAHMMAASLEDRIKAACRVLARRCIHQPATPTCSPA